MEFRYIGRGFNTHRIDFVLPLMQLPLRDTTRKQREVLRDANSDQSQTQLI